MVNEANPTVARRELTLRMHQLREQRKRTSSELASQLGISVPQASKLDTGTRGYQVEDIENLAKWYELDTSDRDNLTAAGVVAEDQNP